MEDNMDQGVSFKEIRSNLLRMDDKAEETVQRRNAE
jgi:hypothetical protein